MARLVLFDIDMTLIDTQRAGRAALAAAFERAFALPDALLEVAIDGRTDHAIFMELLGRHGLAGDDLAAAFERAVAAYLAELPGCISGREGRVLPGVEGLLVALRASHGAIGLATGNMRRGAAMKLEHFGLAAHFACGGFGDATPVRAQVVAEGMRALAKELGVEARPEETVVIGDTPLDVEAAHGAGAKALAVATGRYDDAALQATGAEHVLADLSDTAAVLRILAQ